MKQSIETQSDTDTPLQQCNSTTAKQAKPKKQPKKKKKSSITFTLFVRIFWG